MQSKGWSDKALCWEPFCRDKPICSRNNAWGKTRQTPNKQATPGSSGCMSEEFRLDIFKVITRAVSHIHIYMYIYVCLQIIIFRWPVQIRHWTQTDFPAVPRCCIQKWHYLGYFPTSTDLPELLTYSSLQKMSLVMKKKSTKTFSSIFSRSVQPNSADSPGLPRWGWRCFPTLAGTLLLEAELSALRAANFLPAVHPLLIS